MEAREFPSLEDCVAELLWREAHQRSEEASLVLRRRAIRDVSTLIAEVLRVAVLCERPAEEVAARVRIVPAEVLQAAVREGVSPLDILHALEPGVGSSPPGSLAAFCQSSMDADALEGLQVQPSERALYGRDGAPESLVGPVTIHEPFRGLYMPTELVSRGATGAIFHGHDIRTCQSIALKVFLDPSRCRRPRTSLAERRLIASLSHPCVPRILDFEADDSRVFSWMTMESAGPTTLRSLLSEKKKLGGSWGTLAYVAEQIVDMVEYMHSSAGLFQVDIKPENIALAPDLAVKVLDLGSVLRVGEVPGGMRFGTPGYMAPEYFWLQGIGPKVDVYAIALVLCEIVAGKSTLAPSQAKAVRMGITDWDERVISEIGSYGAFRAPLPAECGDALLAMMKFSVRARDQFLRAPAGIGMLLRRMLATHPEARCSATDAKAALIGVRDLLRRSACPDAGRCLICGDPLTAPSVTCRVCATAAHLECWKYNDQCPLYACGARDFAVEGQGDSD